MTAHTPGPWRVVTDTFVGYEVHSAHHGQVADVLQLPGDTIERVDANARLIAAAPDLLEAVEAIFAEAIDFPETYSTATKERMRSALSTIREYAEAALQKAAEVPS